MSRIGEYDKRKGETNREWPDQERTKRGAKRAMDRINRKRDVCIEFKNGHRKVKEK